MKPDEFAAGLDDLRRRAVRLAVRGDDAENEQLCDLLRQLLADFEGPQPAAKPEAQAADASVGKDGGPSGDRNQPRLF